MAYLSGNKAEPELQQSIQKATRDEETAPKSKHVRTCIVYTWDHNTSGIIWRLIKRLPMLSSEVQTFKALILIHKIIKDGHRNCIKEALQETDWIQTCASNRDGPGLRNYNKLIREYVRLLLHKLKFHGDHPEFVGTFDYEDYTSLKYVDDPNEGYQTIDELMQLQRHVINFKKVVFAELRNSAYNECRISSLVPLVEESYGIYLFLTNMLKAMYKKTASRDALQNLHQQYNDQHYQLRDIYEKCRTLNYLTSLIKVPTLSEHPPTLTDDSTPRLPKRPDSPKKIEPAPEKPAIDTWTQNQIIQQQKEDALRQQQINDFQNQMAEQQRLWELQQEQLRQQELQQQREREEQQRMMAEYERQQREEMERMRQQGLMSEMESRLRQSQMMLEQYDRRVKALEQELAQFQANADERNRSKDDYIKSLLAEIEMWKNKYEALAKLYSQLRDEHVALLKKYKDLQVQANSAREAKDELERMKGEMRAKNMELADLIRERDRARNELARLQSGQQDELDRLRRELEEARDQAQSASKSKRDEISALMDKFSREKAELERSLLEKQALIDEFLKQLEDQQGNADQSGREKDEEIAVLQAAMDDCLAQLAALQQNDKQGELEEQLAHLDREHMAKLDHILDSILRTCVQKVNDGLAELENPNSHGNETATPELTLSIIESASINSGEFLSFFSKFLDGSNAGDHANTIESALSFADTVTEVLLHAKGVTRLVTNDKDADELVRLAQRAGESCQTFFSSVMSSSLKFLRPSQRPDVVIQGDLRVQDALTQLSQKTEDLILASAADINKLEDDKLGDLVEREMSNTARAIEAATARIRDLMSRPQNPSFSATDIQVHKILLESVMMLINAIANLIRCATASQNEIVAQGRGSSTKAAFYKKHNRWTEGLISAARAVAVATNLLVEAADGVISKTHSLEQLIVASNEVSAATAQLVAASRVKSSFMSRTQEQLEMAAKAVKDAAAELVKLVKSYVAQKAPQDDLNIDFNKLSVHEFKRREMEQQVRILKLDSELINARRVLAEMRRSGYHTEETD